jgi:hypothetical protein
MLKEAGVKPNAVGVKLSLLLTSKGINEAANYL